MRDLPPAFAAHLAGGATTLCRCWALRRRDGVARKGEDLRKAVGVERRGTQGPDGGKRPAEGEGQGRQQEGEQGPPLTPPVAEVRCRGRRGGAHREAR